MAEHIIINDEVVVNSTSPENCSFPSDFDRQQIIYAQVSFWLECVAEIGIGILGFLGNALAIPLLMSDRLASTFNRLLICLSIFDNLFILSCLLEAVRRFIGTSNVHQLAFIYFFYQLQSIALLCSIYTTVVLAIERYFAVTRPVEYHMATVSSNPWRRVANYMVPTVLFSILFNVPKFWELEVHEFAVQEGADAANSTIVDFKPTDLRIHPDYSFYYVHLTQLVIKGIVPFGALVFLNLGIYKAIRKHHNGPMSNFQNRRSYKRRSPNQPEHPQEQQVNRNDEHYNEERRCAIVLFVIVILFIVCNAPRIVLNFYEFFNIENLQGPCYSIDLWVMVLTSLSIVLMTINSSVNFFVYCLVNSTFREELQNRWRAMKNAYILPLLSKRQEVSTNSAIHIPLQQMESSRKYHATTTVDEENELKTVELRAEQFHENGNSKGSSVLCTDL